MTATEQDFSGIVGVDFSGPANRCRLYCRRRGEIVVATHKFRPFVLLTAPNAPGSPAISELSGRGEWKYLAEYALPEYEKLLPQLRQLSGVRLWRSYSEMLLLRSGLRFFAALPFDDLIRMQLFPMQDASGKLLQLDATVSSGAATTLVGTESEILHQLNRFLLENDPDVIEAHGLCRRVMPLLRHIAEKTRQPLEWGRDGSEVTQRPSRLVAAERVVAFQRYEVSGRQMIDTEHLALLHDIRNRDFQSLELDYLAGHFDFKLSGASAVDALARLWEPSYFYQARVLPMSLQDLVLRGTGSSLESLLVSGYLQNGHAIPFPEPARSYAGALTLTESFGVFRPVRHCDIRSLYPSLLAASGDAPARDELGLFSRYLKELLAFRLEAKRRSRDQNLTATERREQRMLQEAYKILINSFYGYLGFSQASFNDYDLASSVTQRGRDVLGRMIEALRALQARIIEADTDGIYFVPPENLTPEELETQLHQVLPDGIVLEFDADYPAMFSYKSKNYALLTDKGNVEISGSALRSRALEPFQLKYISAVCQALLTGQTTELPQIYQKYHDAIVGGTIALADLTKQEVLKESPASYRRKLAAGQTRRSAAYEAAIASGRTFKSGDTVRYYVTGNKPKVSIVDNCRYYDPANEVRDENIPYYSAKLDEWRDALEKFADGIGEL